MDLLKGFARGQGRDTIIGSSIEYVSLTNYDDTFVSPGHYMMYIIGGDGNDYVKLNYSAEWTMLGPGNDTVQFRVTAMGWPARTEVSDGPGDDVIIGTGLDDRFFLTFGPGADTVYGMGGNDTEINITDGSPDDTADGGAGTDSCVSDPGDNVVNCEL